MVFRGAGGKIGGSNDIYDLWTSSRTEGLNIPNANVIGKGCRSHYKNKLVEHWSSLRLHQVKLAIYDGRRSPKEIIFDASSTDKRNWMDKHKVVRSSFSDLTSWQDYQYFGLAGHADNTNRRRFFIHKSYGGCENDYGWFVVSERANCDWERGSTLPVIKYSPYNHADRYTRGSPMADEFAIYLLVEDKCKIPRCVQVSLDCFITPNGQCDKCDHSLPVKKINNGRKCAWKCSHLERECWPGTCSDELADNCVCDKGFSVSKDQTKAKCILTIPPKITTCFAGVVGRNNQHVILKTTNGSSRCESQEDNFINFDVKTVEFTLQYFLLVNISKAKPSYINTYKFGIGGGSVGVFKINSKGIKNRVLFKDLSIYHVNKGDPKDTINVKKNFTISPNVAMDNGERLCFEFSAIGSGYLITEFASRASSKKYYNDTYNNEKRCFWFDDLKPVHCRVTKKCHGMDIMQISNPITDSPRIKIGLRGWKDNEFYHGKVVNSSGINYYEINVYLISGDGNVLQVSTESDKNNRKKVLDGADVEINLSQCGLYEVRLEVVDKAGESGVGNGQMSRRFVLFDNCSNVQLDPNNDIIVTSADNVSHYRWQTVNGHICFKWTMRFFNTLHKKTNLLKEIEGNSLISEVYDDLEMPLPRNGTVNSDGIVNFNYSVFVNDHMAIKPQNHMHVMKQFHCINMSFLDGDKVKIEITAEDIMSNSRKDSVVVLIDTTVPEMFNFGLTKEKSRGLFVHNSAELSKMNMTFSAQDVHSGLRSIEWYMGTSPGSTNIGHGVLAVQRLKNKTTCPDHTECYCPFHGECELSSYSIGLSKLILTNKNKGQHNREYYFTFVATNNAFLKSIDHIEVLVDDSAPDKGVVKEGAIDEPDVDFTNVNSTIVSWKGFIDHESGIRFFKVAFSRSCLSQQEILNNTNENEITYINTTDEFVKFWFPKTGKYVTSVLAFNNAMEPSDVACSDGITFDISAVKIFNFSGQQFKTREGIACDSHGDPFLVLKDLTRVSLNKSSLTCSLICKQFKFPSYIASLPVLQRTDNDVKYADGICKTVNPFKGRSIYLPSDHIHLKWEFVDKDSQLQDFFVGFGSSDSEYITPDLVMYSSTSHHSYYDNFHSGLRASQKFWLFLKGTNKAGVDAIFQIGPLIIDSTPLVVTKDLHQTIANKRIYIGWENDTFKDTEQDNPADLILFRIGSGNRYITPYYQHYSRVNNCPDKDMIDCIVYPVERLRHQDTETTLQYFVEMQIYNGAGHLTIYKTSSFLLPSLIPPAGGIVIETAGHWKDFNDIDYLLYPNQICIRWKGFGHHRNITFQAGIGSKPQTDDVIHYQGVSNNEGHCFKGNYPQMKPFIKYYSSVKARCSGGTTVVSSDGVVLLDTMKVTSTFHSQLGEQCSELNTTIKMTKLNSTEVNIMHFATGLEIGKIYTLLFTENYKELQSDDIMQIKYSNFSDKNYYIFTPIVNNPIFHISSTQPKLHIFPCNMDISAVRATDRLSIVWNDLSGLTIPTHYLIELWEGSRNDDILGTDLIKTVASGEMVSYLFSEVLLKNNGIYKVLVSPCFGHVCLNGSKTTFRVQDDPTEVNISFSEISNTPTCLLLQAAWDKIQFPHFKVWTIALNSYGTHNMTNWKAIDQHKEELSVCLHETINLKRSTYFCLKTWLWDRKWINKCVPITITDMSSGTDMQVFDTNQKNIKKKTLTTIMDAIHSTNLGDIEKLIHDLEVDYITSQALLSGLITGHNGMKLEVFLMTSPVVPSSKEDCKTRRDCVSTFTTENGLVSYNNLKMNHGDRYFTCIRSQRNDTKCSDGVIVDDTPPQQGTVTVASKNGFINTLSSIYVSTDGFEEDERGIGDFQTSLISYYHYGIGTEPNLDDVSKFENVSDIGVIHLTNAMYRNGETYYISVAAVNNAGSMSKHAFDKFIIDVTPPTSGILYIGDELKNKYLTNKNDIEIYWDGFEDDESSIMSFECGLLSDMGELVIPYINVEGNSMIMKDHPNITDGHSYKAALKVKNRADLMSLFYSNPVLIDSSPPSVGVVFDGDRLNEDIDYQSNSQEIHVNWKEFHDIHSGIAFYRVALGGKPFSDDIKPFRNVGLVSAMSWKLDFIQGKRYFTTVEACNNARLCTKATSDGLIIDTSTPINGIIYIHGKTGHRMYLSDRTSLSVSWIGFEDPHSDVEHFEWCIGTTAKICNILPWENCYLSNNVFKTGLKMPTKTDMIVSVRAFNNANLTKTVSSYVFQIDTTPPSIIETPKIIPFTLRNSLSTPFQYDNSIIKLAWHFTDSESPIVSHSVSLRNHHGGKVPFEKVLYDNVQNVSIVFNKTNRLMSGDKYFAMVTSCNGAKLCTTAHSQNVLIDSTPPIMGGFSAKHPWKTSINHGDVYVTTTLTWFGFEDVESDIAYYMLSVGKTFHDHAFTEGVVNISGNASQTTIQLKGFSPFNHTELILSLYAVNNVGLKSRIRRVTVDTSMHGKNGLTGDLILQRHSCKIHYCNKECTCSVLGKKCDSISSNKCNEYNNTDVDLTVYGGTTPLKHTPVQLSTACISGSWKTSYTFKRFEWTVGLSGQKPGEGVFDLKTEDPWLDVALDTYAVYCLKTNQSFKNDWKYRVFVKGWISFNSFFIAESEDIDIKDLPPHIKMGKFISESRDVPCGPDIAYAESHWNICACWKNVFYDRGSMQYSFSIGTSPNSDDVLTTVQLMGNQTFCPRVNYVEGMRYFFTVRAYNDMGLYSTLSSDGFVIDNTLPRTGIVFNTMSFIDKKFVSSKSTFGTSWYGFEDRHSFVKNYTFSMQKYVNDSFQCIENAQSTDFLTSVKVTTDKITETIPMRYEVKVSDAAGHVSDSVFSPSFKVDFTSPEGYRCLNYTLKSQNSSSSRTVAIQTHLLKSQLYTVDVLMRNLTLDTRLVLHFGDDVMRLPIIFNANNTASSHISIMSKNVGLHDIFVSQVQYELCQMEVRLFQCESIRKDSKRVIKVNQVSGSSFSICINAKDPNSGISKTTYSVGTTKNGSQVQWFEDISGGHHHTFFSDVPHGSPLYAQAVIKNHADMESHFTSERIVIDHTPPIIEKIKSKLDYEQKNNSTFTKVSGSFIVRDEESGIEYCKFCIDTDGYSVDEKLCDSVSEWTFTSRSLNVPHGTKLTVIISCVNSVEMKSETAGHPNIVAIATPDISGALIDFLVPNPTLLINGFQTQTDLDTIDAKWTGFKDNMGIKMYECKLSEDTRTVVPWFSVGKHNFVSLKNLPLKNGHIYTLSVRAVNEGGLRSDYINSSLQIYTEKPRLTGVDAYIEQVNGKMVIKWNGVFKNNDKMVASYNVRIGTNSGFSDILSIEDIKNTDYKLDADIGHLSVAYVVIEAIYPTGITNTYQGTIIF